MEHVDLVYPVNADGVEALHCYTRKSQANDDGASVRAAASHFARRLSIL